MLEVIICKNEVKSSIVFDVPENVEKPNSPSELTSACLAVNPLAGSKVKGGTSMFAVNERLVMKLEMSVLPEGLKCTSLYLI